MYLQYFGLREEPFGATPDPRFLYLGPTHREAMASLEYRVNAGCGFIALFSVPGMGKTTLLFQLLQSLRSRAETAFIFQTQCASRELMRQLLSELQWGQECGDDLVAILNRLKQGMLRTAAAGKRVVIVIDEAQNLTPSVLESVRLLSNFETPKAKLVQIVLSGQPQLARTLNRPELSQLRQRITIANRLKPLSPLEVYGYVEHRLRVAGYNGERLFSDSAIRALAEGSRGIPRIINNLCFNALSMGFALDRRCIFKSLMEEVIADLDMSLPIEENELSEISDPASIPGSEPRYDYRGEPPSDSHTFAEEAQMIFGASTQSSQHSDFFANVYADLANEPQEADRSPVLPDYLSPSIDDPRSMSQIFSTADPVVARADARVPAPTISNRSDILPDPKVHPNHHLSHFLRHHVAVIVGILLLGSISVMFVILRIRGGSNGTTVSASVKAIPNDSPVTPDSPPEKQTASTAEPSRLAPGSINPVSRHREHQPEPEAIILPGAGMNHKPSAPGLEPDEVPAPRIATLANSQNLSSLPIAASKPATFRATSPAQSSSSFEPAQLLESQSLKYPAAARSAHIEGVVTVKATISPTGEVEKVSLVNGPIVLASTTLEAVRNWRYKPASVGGKPVVSETMVTVKYNLNSTGER